MANRRLLAIITVLMLAGGTLPSHADYSLSQLNEIEAMINAQDWIALRSFVAANPGVLSGNTALGEALQDFMDASAGQGSLIGDLSSFDPGVAAEAVSEAQESY